MDPSNLAYVSMVVGFLLPHAIALINQEHWRSSTKSIIAFAACIAAALVTTYLKGDFNVHEIAGSTFIVFTVARASYAGLWRPTKIATTVESATTFTTREDDYATA